MGSKVVSLDEARSQKRFEEREERAEALKDRFAKALGLKDKPKKSSLWGKGKGKKPRK